MLKNPQKSWIPIKSIQIIIVVTICSFIGRSMSSKPPILPFHRSEIQLADGEKQYRLIHSNANLPQYGRCWTTAIQHIDPTCTDLNELTQARLAIEFTKCFISMSGGDGAEEGSDADLNGCNTVECMGNMSERVFQAYTQFYTHTQNICFYLRHQIWHSETERTITALQSHSHSVSKQLEVAGRLQMSLLQQQREGLKVQRQLVENGGNLSAVLLESRGSLARLTEQFRNSTIEQGRQLGDLFTRLAQFHNWIVGEYTFIEQIMYFSVLLLAIWISTTSKRTENARFVLFLLTTVNVGVESVFQRYLGDDFFVEDLQIVVFEYLWLIRKVFIIVMIGVYAMMSVLYVDSHQITINLLNRVEKQNELILEMLRDLQLSGEIRRKVPSLRPSVDRELFSNLFSPAPRLSVIQEQSMNRTLTPSVGSGGGVTTRSRSRQSTPIMSMKHEIP